MFAWLIAGSLVVGVPALKDKPLPQDLYGEWELVGTVANGQQLPAAHPPHRYRFNRDGTWQSFRGDQAPDGRSGFEFDPKAGPPALDFNSPPGVGDGPPVLAIYKVTGDRLTFCSVYPGKARPTEFAAPAGSDAYLKHFRRVQAKD
jgi:uncharacterized protein (TIGR03067 family)